MVFSAVLIIVLESHFYICLRFLSLDDSASVTRLGEMSLFSEHILQYYYLKSSLG
jgi:hypothetical protein